MNINFSTDPGFSAYVLLLMFSGLAMVLVGSPVVRRQRPLSRVLNIVFGIGFFGYGFYLAFIFQGGHYVLFFKAFILPAVLIIRAIAGARRSRSASAASSAAAPHWQSTPPPPPGFQTPQGFQAPQAQWSAPQTSQPQTNLAPPSASWAPQPSTTWSQIPSLPTQAPQAPQAPPAT